MAIRPVDLQLAYMAAPQNAALVSHAQDSPQTAQQAAQAAFAAELERREEHVDGPQRAEGQKIRPREDRDPGEEGSRRRQRQRRQLPYESDAAPSALGLAGEGEHFIDVTA
jgi:RNA-splicing ligase RtcB